MLSEHVRETYERWREYPHHPSDVAEELAAIADDEAAIADRFYSDLSFGTGGLRGVLGAGTNRMNVYTVRRTTLGLARWLLAEGVADRGVAVGYDCRRMSREFAVEVGSVLAAAGIRVHVFEQLCPTPLLSFAVRELGAAAGVMITASHNPPEYNGYKVYDSQGCQVLDAQAMAITKQIESVSNLFDIPLLDPERAERDGLWSWVGEALEARYRQEVLRAMVAPTLAQRDRERLRIVYTPLHGAGNRPIRAVLDAAGYGDVHIVSSQERPDGSFPTVQSPNPEEPAALAEAVRLARELDADIAMGTDPDADRLGIAVRTDTGAYELLTGNQVGALLIDFVLSQRAAEGRLPARGVVFKTVVTAELGAVIAERYGVRVENTLTGFKYIGDRIGHYERTGEFEFVFGYEESYGYLAASFVRDKDAVQTALLVCEMAAHHKRQGKTLVDVLHGLYARHGWYKEALISQTLPGADGMHRMAELMERLRKDAQSVAVLPITAVEDYQTGIRRALRDAGGSWTEEALLLPRSNVLKYLFDGGSWLAVRPSGTEPKIKFYLGAHGPDEASCDRTLQSLRTVVGEVAAI